VCVYIESTDRSTEATWGTVGASENIIEATWAALKDSIIYGLWRKQAVKGGAVLKNHAKAAT